MRILEFALHTIKLPLVTPFTTGASTQTEGKVLIIELTAEVDGALVIGWGECGALTEPVDSSEYLDGVIAVTTDHLLPRLAAASSADELTAESVAGLLAKVVGHRMAKAAIEMAVLDAQLRAAGLSFKGYLGVTRDRVPSGVSVGIQGSIPQLLDTVDGYLAKGYRRIKLKIRPGWDIDPVRAVREAHPDLPLQADGRGAYTIADADHLAQLDSFDLLLIEQPFGEEAMRHHARLAQRMRTPMCLGGSVVSAASAEDAIVWGAAAIVNIKPSHVGGYLEARRIHDVALAHETPVWCGGRLGTGIASGANAALAGMPGFTITGDISASGCCYKQDITQPFELVDGHILIPDVPGVSVQPRRQRLAEATLCTMRVGFP